MFALSIGRFKLKSRYQSEELDHKFFMIFKAFSLTILKEVNKF